MENKKFIGIALIVLTSVNIFLHVYRISWPARPVFDEAHFATYASDYAQRKAHFDIHPPLGKAIYGTVIALFGGNLGDTEFVTINPDPVHPGKFLTIDNKLLFGKEFPYVALRLVSALFGILLSLVFFWFLRSLGVSIFASFLGAVFVSFETALLLETRLILLNGMYLVFGFAGLAAYFGRVRRPILAGLLLGASLGVKLLGVIFIAPLFLEYWIALKEQRKELWYIFCKTILVCVITFFVIVFAGYSFFPLHDRVLEWQRLHVFSFHISSPSVSKFPFWLTTSLQYAVEPLWNLGLGAGGYVWGDKNAWASESSWYLWPAMQRPMVYYQNASTSENELVLQGNPIVWFSATLAAIFALAVLPRYLFQRVKSGIVSPARRTLILLISGYVANLLPFILVVRRTTFLYHYFPALLFSIGIVAWGFDRIFKFRDSLSLNRMQIIAMVGIVFVVVVGFIYFAHAVFANFPKIF